MAEQQGNDKYIKCSSCKCKHINDAEHIEVDFGYNRLDERFKTCNKCRSKFSVYCDTQHGIDTRKAYYDRKGKAYNCEKLTCSTCGAIRGRGFMRAHEKQNGCARNDIKRLQKINSMYEYVMFILLLWVMFGG